MSRASSRSEPIWSAGPASARGKKLDRLADVAQRVIDQVSEGVNLGRLRFTRDDQALASVRRQIARQRLDPAGMCGQFSPRSAPIA